MMNVLYLRESNVELLHPPPMTRPNLLAPRYEAFYVFLSCVCFVFVRVCLYLLCGHLLGKGWPFGSLLWCLTVSLSLSHWYPGSGVVLDCIDS